MVFALFLVLLVVGLVVGVVFVSGIMFFFFGLDLVVDKTLSGVSDWPLRRGERDRQLTTLAQMPETSLLRAGEAPTSPPDVLVRPVVERSNTDPEHLLRVSQGE